MVGLFLFYGGDWWWFLEGFRMEVGYLEDWVVIKSLEFLI